MHLVSQVVIVRYTYLEEPDSSTGQNILSVLSLSRAFHRSEKEVLQVELGDREVGAGQGGGGGRTVVKILSEYRLMTSVEHIRTLQDLNMQLKVLLASVYKLI